MYSILEVKSNVRVHPKFLGKKLKESIKSAIEHEFVGALGNHGIFLSVLDVKEVGEGSMISGDGAVYYETIFETLVYRPEMHEVVEGIVSEITEFGAFLRIGPIDGLVHVSQVMDDYVSYGEAGVLQGKESKHALKAKDIVRARIIAVSLKNMKGAKLGLTMRQPGLGKVEWVEADKKRAEEIKSAGKEEAVDETAKPKPSKAKGKAKGKKK